MRQDAAASAVDTAAVLQAVVPLSVLLYPPQGIVLPQFPAVLPKAAVLFLLPAMGQEWAHLSVPSARRSSAVRSAVPAAADCR